MLGDPLHTTATPDPHQRVEEDQEREQQEHEHRSHRDEDRERGRGSLQPDGEPALGGELQQVLPSGVVGGRP